MRVFTSREFNQDISQAKRVARSEPVFVTDRGRATHVLMSVEAYRKITGQAETIVDLLAIAAPVTVDPRQTRSDEAWDSPSNRRG